MLPSGDQAGLPCGEILRALEKAIGNHVFCALRAFLKLEERRSRGLIASWYELIRIGDRICNLAGHGFGLAR
jgi:hypothetical protein